MSSKTRLFVMLAVAFSLAGCAPSWDGTVKGTKSLYKNYLNPPAEINYDDKGSLSEAEALLASQMKRIDIQLLALERYLENDDRPPTPQSVAALFNRFPWVGGFAAVDTAGQVLAQEPPVGLKQLDMTAVVELKARGGGIRGVRGTVQDTQLGPEVLMSVPVYRNLELMGYLVAHFDMRTLAPLAEKPEDLIILSPQAVLWPGRFEVDSTPLAGKDWMSIVKSSVYGTMSNAQGEFLWVARFIGVEPLIFGVPIKGSFIENPAQMSDVHPAPVFSGPVVESDASKGVGTSILRPPSAEPEQDSTMRPITD